jgi:hypothetical protein
MRLVDDDEATAEVEVGQRTRLARITAVEKWLLTVTEEQEEIPSQTQRRRIEALEQAQSVRRAQLRVQDRIVTQLERRLFAQEALEAQLRGGFIFVPPVTPTPALRLHPEPVTPEWVDDLRFGSPRGSGSSRSASTVSSDESDGFRTADEEDDAVGSVVSPGSAA